MNLNPIHSPGWPDEPTLPIPLLQVEPQQPDPAEACTELGAETENLTGWPLEPLLARYAWLGPGLVVLVVVTWMCADNYLELAALIAP